MINRNPADHSVCAPTRETATRPASSGSRKASSTRRSNSGNSSRKSTSRSASVTSPGPALGPPPMITFAEAERSDAALEKVARRTLKDGSPVHSFRTLLHELSTIVRNTCQARTGPHNNSTFQMITTPTPAQHRALQLLQSIAV